MSSLNRHEEFEQVLRGMRDRLVSVSEEVARALTKANWHAETAPSHIRGRVQAGIADITNTQEWMHGRLAQLPDDPQMRFAAMQEMLQVQFVAVQKVTSILDELLALRNKPVAPEYLPPEMRPPPPEPTFPLPTFEASAPIARDFGPALATPATAPLFDAPPTQPLFSLQAPPAPMQPALQIPGPGPVNEPRWGPPPGPAPLFGPPPGPAPLFGPAPGPTLTPVEMPRALAPRPPESIRAPAKKSARKYGPRGRGKSRTGLVTAGLVAAIAIVGTGGYFTWSQAIAPKKPQRIAIGDPSARSQSTGGTSSAPVRTVDAVASRVPQAPPMSAPPLGDDFVPVIGTHREKDGLTNIFMDLRKQYPQIVATRKAIAQTVNLGSDGVWYQLVLLPPGPKEQAEAICEELRQAGYPRCAVRPNKP